MIITMKKFNLVSSFLKSLISFMCVIFSIWMIDEASYNDGYEHIFNETYGGDAYTGIQNAAASTANYISRFSRELFECVVIIGIILAFAFFILFLHNLEAFLKIFAEIRAESQEKRNQQMLSYFRENSNSMGNPNFMGNPNNMNPQPSVENPNFTVQPDYAENQNYPYPPQTPENVDISDNNNSNV